MSKVMNNAAKVLFITDDPALNGRSFNGMVCLFADHPTCVPRLIVRIADTLQAGGIVFLPATLGNVIGGMIEAADLVGQIPLHHIVRGEPRAIQRLLIVQVPDGNPTRLEDQFRHVQVPHFQFVDPAITQGLQRPEATTEPMRIILQTLLEIND